MAEAVEALVNCVKKAWAAHDLEKVLTYYTEDVCFIYSDAPGILQGKAQVRDRLQQELERTENMDITVVDRVIGENIISEVGNYCCKLKGQDKSEHGRYAVTYVKRGGKWLVKYDTGVL